MNRLLLFLVVFACMNAVQADVPNWGLDTITPTIVNEAYTVNNVRRLRMQLKGDVLINQGPRDALYVEGLKDVIKNIRVSVVGGVVTIRYRETPADRLKKQTYPHPLIFRLTVTDFQGIEMSSGTVQSTELRTKRPFTINFSGDAVGNLAVFASELRVDMSGTSQMQMRGGVNKEYVTTRNRSRFLAQEVLSETTRVDIRDESQAFVHARLVLEGTVQDDGELHVIGIPQSNQVTTAGLGTVNGIPQKPITPPPTPQELPSSPNFHGQGWNSVP